MRITTLAWRNIGRNRRRSVLSMTAIAVATLSVVTLFSLLEGMKADLMHNLTTFYTGEVQIRHRDYTTYEHLAPLHLSVPEAASVRDRLEGIPGVADAVVRLGVPGAVFQDSERTGLQAVGVDFADEEGWSAVEEYVVAGSLDAALAPDERITPVLAGKRVPDRLGIELGETFTLLVRTAQRGTNAMTFRIVAIADFPVQSMNGGTVWAPLHRVQTLAGMPGAATEVLVRLDDASSPAAALPRIREAYPDLAARHISEIDTTYGFIEMASNMYNVIGVFFFLLASTVIVNTTMMVIFERRREIGTLEAMGMQRRELIRLFFSESLILGFLGSLAGLVLGIALSVFLGRIGIDMGAAMEGVDMEISPVLYPVVNLRSTGVVFVMAIVVSGITSFFPMRKITRIEPVAALREE
jgi:putative ABC transport system permease protein